MWDLITDWEHQGDWMLEASDFAVTGETREGVGVTAAATIRIAGIRTTDRIVVTGWEPNRRLGIQHEGWVAGAGEIHLTPLGPGRTHVFWKEELIPPMGVVGAIGLLAFKPLMTRLFRRDLRVLGALVRARGKAR